MSELRNRDILFHILYTDDMRTTLEFCKGAVERIAAELRDTEAVRLYEIARRSPHSARCVFFLLLNVDMGLKEAVCRSFLHEATGVTLKGLCPHKAPVLFRELGSRVVPRFLRDELRLSVDFERELREVYQYS